MKCCCCSRSMFGLYYGCITLSIYGIGIFGSILLLANNTACLSFAGDDGNSSLLALVIVNLIFSSLMYIVTALLIASIIKKRPRLLVPWMVVSMVNILASSGYTLYLVFTPQRYAWLGTVGAIVVVIQSLIVCIIYMLYRDLKMEYYMAVAPMPERMPMKTIKKKGVAVDAVDTVK